MVNQSSTTTLAFALLGLISQKPYSGYDLRKFFSSTPMTSFSDSPGAIYPALRRLERRGLIRGRVDAGKDRRKRRLFEATPRGRAEFRRWQLQPITRDDVVHHVDSLMLRFAFMDESVGRAIALRFLKALHKELASYIPTLHQYLKANRSAMPLSGRLALESGILGYESLFRWTKAAIAAYQKEN
jgi:DNA-binding PadR family transcriptional regulator